MNTFSCQNGSQIMVLSLNLSEAEAQTRDKEMVQLQETRHAAELLSQRAENGKYSRAATFTHVNRTVSCFCNKRLQNWPTVYTNFTTWPASWFVNVAFSNVNPALDLFVFSDSVVQSNLLLRPPLLSVTPPLSGHFRAPRPPPPNDFACKCTFIKLAPVQRGQRPAKFAPEY